MMKSNFIVLIFALFLSCCSPNYIPFNSPKAFTDPRDNERYGFVEINNRYWMTENMRYDVKGSKLNPDNPSTIYGRLYKWEQAMEACPKEWRLATHTDWMSIERIFVFDRAIRVEGRKYRGNNVKILKSKQDWHPAGTDSLKMNILPAGSHAFGTFNNLGTVAGFWTSNSHLAGGKMAEQFAYNRIIAKDKEGIYFNTQDKKIYYSCRCVRSLENNPWKDL